LSRPWPEGIGFFGDEAGLCRRKLRQHGIISDKASLTADEMIGMHMLTSNLPEDPDELTRIAGIYEKYGLLEETLFH
jgi:hypothetical protein